MGRGASGRGGGRLASPNGEAALLALGMTWSVCWLSLGCEGADSGAGNAAGAPSSQAGRGSIELTEPESVEDFFVQEARALCDRIFRCWSPRDDDRSLVFLFGSREVCESEVAFANARNPSVADLRLRLAAGELELAPKNALSCLQELASCGEADALGEGSCREAFEGKVAEGGDCQRDEDCSGNSYCAGELTCPGQCRPRGLPGSPCATSRQCAYRGSPIYCVSTETEAQCRELERRAKAGLGAECTRSPLTAQAFAPCQDDLWCAPVAPDDLTGFGVCERPIEGEGACDDDDAVCIDGFCNVALGKCQPYSLVRREGAECGDARQLFCDPLRGLQCSDDDAGGTCLKQGDGSLGSVCFSGDFQRGCDVGSYCSRPTGAASGTCVTKRAAGEPCEGSSQCGSGECATTCQARYCGL